MLRSASVLVLMAVADPVRQMPSTVAACLRGGRATARWELPPAMREVSGLALTDDGRLLVHNDERGAVLALDASTGRPLGRYRLGKGLRADFEGMAVVGRKLFVTTSDGDLVVADLPAKAAPDTVLAVTAIRTGVGAHCEVEGLSYDQVDRVLLMACKAPRGTSLRTEVAVFRWDPATRALASPDRVSFSERDLSRGRPGRGFHPSALEVDPRSGEWVMLASADQAMVTVDRAGRVIATARLGGVHPQPEGLALGPDGSAYVGDEGGKGPGTVTVYACR